MAGYGKESEFQLRTVHPRLQALFREVVRHYDNKIVEGHRGEAAQNRAVREGKSKLAWPKGNHNAYPSRAVDAYPFPIDMKDMKRFYHFAGFVQGVAAVMGIKIRWGGDWDGDKDLNDNAFADLVHFELSKEEL